MIEAPVKEDVLQLDESITVPKGQELIVLKNPKITFFDNQFVSHKKTNDKYAHATLHTDQFYCIYERTKDTIPVEFKQKRTYNGRGESKVVDVPVFSFTRIRQKSNNERNADMLT